MSVNDDDPLALGMKATLREYMPLWGRHHITESEFLAAAIAYGDAVHAYNLWWILYPARSEKATRLRLKSSLCKSKSSLCLGM